MSARRTAAFTAVTLLTGLLLAPSAPAAAGTGTRIGPFKGKPLGVLGTYAKRSRAGAVVAPAPAAPPRTTTAAPAGPTSVVPSQAPGTLVGGPAGAVVDTTTSPAPAAPAAAAPAAPAPAAPPVTTPDPAALPVGDLPGWKQVLAEDFNGTALPAGWGKYSGTPGSAPDGWWDPSHVTVGQGALHLNGYRDGGRWVTGGVMNTAAGSTTYGKYEVRFRMAKGVGVKYAILLWPRDENWPIGGEIDFAEDGGGNRTHTAATLHYGADNRIIQREIFGQDFSVWNTVGVEWTPGKLVYTLNGKPWATVESPNVPTGAMDLAIQTETGSCGDRWLPCPDASTPDRVDLDVDWVAVWERA